MTNKMGERWSLLIDISPFCFSWDLDIRLSINIDSNSDLKIPRYVPMVNETVEHLSRLMTNPTKWHMRPADSDQPGHPPSLIRVITVWMKKAWFLSYSLSTQRRLIWLGGCPGWSESSLGAHASLLVLTRGGPFYVVMWQLWKCKRTIKAEAFTWI